MSTVPVAATAARIANPVAWLPVTSARTAPAPGAKAVASRTGRPRTPERRPYPRGPHRSVTAVAWSSVEMPRPTPAVIDAATSRPTGPGTTASTAELAVTRPNTVTRRTVSEAERARGGETRRQPRGPRH